MPRDSSGVMTLPAGNPVIPGTLIESTWANPTMSDIANELTGSLPRSGVAPMTGPLMLARDGILPKEATTVDQLNGALAGSNNYLPAGAIQYFAMVAIPTGWLEANGAAVSRTTYANLFATIGTVFGAGNGTTTFNLPDLRGTFIRGYDNGRSLDPGRKFGSQQAGSNAAHNHLITDPGHTHSQAAHTHGVTDPGHDHTTVASPGTWYADGTASGTPCGPAEAITSSTSTTHISIQNSQPAIAYSVSGTSTAPSGGEARPVNVALVACIKAFGALQTDGLGTMAFQNKDAVNVTGGVGVFSSLQCTKVPTDPDDVARLSDVGGVNEIYSSDIQTVVVDSTDPLIPIIRPQTNVPNGLAKLNSAGQIPTSLISVSDINYQGPWDASTGNTPSQEYPLVTFGDGDTYQISVLGTLTVYGPDGTASPTPCVVGSSITYVTGSPTFPTAGWYYNPPVSFSGAAASGISFTPVGEISATNVQAMGAELDSEKAPKTSPSFTGILETEQAINVTKPYGSLQVVGVEAMRFGGADGDNSGQLAGFRNVLINGRLNINQRNVTIAAAAIGAYGPDRWKKVDASNMTQIVEDGNYKYSSVYILSGTGVTTQQVTSPASGHWTIPSIPITAAYVQLELGSIATPFENRPYGLELALCQRYCQWIPFGLGFIAASAGAILSASVPFQGKMRAVPTIGALSIDTDIGANILNNATQVFLPIATGSTASVAQLSAVAAGACYVYGYHALASAEL